MIKNGSHPTLQAAVRSVLACAVFTTLLLAAGCGGHSRIAPAPTPTPSPGITAAQLRIGDAPADRVIDFEVSFGSPIIVTLSTGQTASLTINNNRWELSHMAAKLEPLSVQGFPQGSVTSIQIPLINPEVTYLDNTGVAHTFSGSPQQTVTVNLNPPLSIGTAPTIVTLDINVASTLTFDPSGAVTAINFSSSTFTFGTKAIAAEAEQQDDNGEMEGVTGRVTLVNGSNFELDAGQGGASITFATDNTTQFDEGLTLATLLNKIVKVEGFTKTDGTVFAKEVELLEIQSGAELEGLITAIPGPNLASNSLGFFLQDGTGNGMDPAKIGHTFTVDLTNFTNYTVDLGKCDMSGTAFTFNASHISPGQRIEVELPAGVPATDGTTAVPDQIKLEQQALTGVVAIGSLVQKGGGATEFDLTLPTDSYLTLLTGAHTVHVFLQSGTDNRVTVAEDATIRVRGLLFFNPPPLGIHQPVIAISTAQFNLVARRVTAP